MLSNDLLETTYKHNLGELISFYLSVYLNMFFIKHVVFAFVVVAIVISQCVDIYLPV